MSQRLKQKYREFCAGNPQFVCSPGMAESNPGLPTTALLDLGLSKAELKKLEGLGYVLRGRTPIKVVGLNPKKRKVRWSGPSMIRWVLLNPEELEVGEA